MSTAAIQVNRLNKVFQVSEREEGLKAALRSLVKRRFKEVRAVNEISFQIQPGEVVGFLGPNGAGKTTTLKMLSGLLHPSAGEGKVLGFTPYRREGLPAPDHPGDGQPQPAACGTSRRWIRLS